MSVNGFWNDFFLTSEIRNQSLLVSLVLLISTVFLLIYNKKTSKFSWNSLFEYASILILLVYFLNNIDDYLSIILANIIIFILGVGMIKKGTDTTNFGILNYGLLIITALISLRFFDTEMTFVIRGLIFISVGVGFFVSNYLMLKKSRKKA